MILGSNTIVLIGFVCCHLDTNSDHLGGGNLIYSVQKSVVVFS